MAENGTNILNTSLEPRFDKNYIVNSFDKTFFANSTSNINGFDLSSRSLNERMD